MAGRQGRRSDRAARDRLGGVEGRLTTRHNPLALGCGAHSLISGDTLVQLMPSMYSSSINFASIAKFVRMLL
jgi:hypothetical protein